MRINVAQLLKQPVGTARRYPIRARDEEGNRVEGEATLLRTNRSILVTADLKTTVATTCSRCLEPMEYSLDLRFEEEYFPTRDVVTGAALEMPEEGADFTIDEAHVLDLGEAVRQYTLLALPMKLVCREDCAGLCPRCGRNLNQGPCECPVEEEASPLSNLRGILAGITRSQEES